MGARKNLLSIFLLLFLVNLGVTATKLDEDKKMRKVKYKSSKRVDFESLLIEGERRKPEMSVVTGNIGKKDSGLLKFRKDFLDAMAIDFGEKVE